MKQQAPNTKTTKAFAPEHASLQAQGEVTIKKCPYLKPEIQLTYVQTENGFTNGSVAFINAPGDIQVEVWESAIGGSQDIDF